MTPSSPTGKKSPAAPASPPAAGSSSLTPGSPGAPRVSAPPVALPDHWANQPLPEDDADSAFEDAASSTASISSSILKYRTINGRTFHSDRGNINYWGANDERQNTTQEIMHNSFLRVLNNKLHLAPLSKDIEKVVEIGTGTGVWAIDFADEFPDTQIIGTDLSPVQPVWVPPNMLFEIDDFTQPWTFQGDSIDFVYGRWLVGSIVNYTKHYKEAYRVLKPGGWIESFELDGDIQCDDGTLKDNMALAQWGSIFREGGKSLKTGASYNPVQEGLQRPALEAAGYVNITEVPVKIPVSEWPDDPNLKEAGQYWRAGLNNDVEGIATYMATQLGWSATDISVYCAHMRREMRSLKVHAYFRGNVAYAQKPPKA